MVKWLKEPIEETSVGKFLFIIVFLLLFGGAMGAFLQHECGKPRLVVLEVDEPLLRKAVIMGRHEGNNAAWDFILWNLTNHPSGARQDSAIADLYAYLNMENEP